MLIVSNNTLDRQ